MKKLNERTKALLMQGIGANMVESFEFCQESLYVNEAREIYEFCKWVDENVGGCSRYNIDRLFEAWKKPTEENMQFVEELRLKIKQIRDLTTTNQPNNNPMKRALSKQISTLEELISEIEEINNDANSQLQTMLENEAEANAVEEDFEDQEEESESTEMTQCREIIKALEKTLIDLKNARIEMDALSTD